MDYKNHSKSLAFSLIELMVAIAVIAVLTAIATPIYVNYTIKANVSSALPILDGLKNQASEFYISNGTFPSGLAAINATSYTDGKIISSTNFVPVIALPHVTIVE